MQSATGIVVIAGLFAIIRGSYFLPIEARLPPSAAYFISGFYETGLIVEQSAWKPSAGTRSRPIEPVGESTGRCSYLFKAAIGLATFTAAA
jgi:hypothetical protein